MNRNPVHRDALRAYEVNGVRFLVGDPEAAMAALERHSIDGTTDLCQCFECLAARAVLSGRVPLINKGGSIVTTNTARAAALLTTAALTLSAQEATSTPAPTTAAEAMKQSARLADDAKGWKSSAFPASCRVKIQAVTGVAAAPPEVVTAFRKTFTEGASQLPGKGEEITLTLTVKNWKKGSTAASFFIPASTRFTSTLQVEATAKDGRLIAVMEIAAKSKDGDGGMSPNDGEICASKSWITFRSALSL